MIPSKDAKELLYKLFSEKVINMQVRHLDQTRKMTDTDVKVNIARATRHRTV